MNGRTKGISTSMAPRYKLTNGTLLIGQLRSHMNNAFDWRQSYKGLLTELEVFDSNKIDPSRVMCNHSMLLDTAYIFSWHNGTIGNFFIDAGSESLEPDIVKVRLERVFISHCGSTDPRDYVTQSSTTLSTSVKTTAYPKICQSLPLRFRLMQTGTIAPLSRVRCTNNSDDKTTASTQKSAFTTPNYETSTITSYMDHQHSSSSKAPSEAPNVTISSITSESSQNGTNNHVSSGPTTHRQQPTHAQMSVTISNGYAITPAEAHSLSTSHPVMDNWSQGTERQSVMVHSKHPGHTEGLSTDSSTKPTSTMNLKDILIPSTISKLGSTRITPSHTMMKEDLGSSMEPAVLTTSGSTKNVTFNRMHHRQTSISAEHGTSAYQEDISTPAPSTIDTLETECKCSCPCPVNQLGLVAGSSMYNDSTYYGQNTTHNRTKRFITTPKTPDDEIKPVIPPVKRIPTEAPGAEWFAVIGISFVSLLVFAIMFSDYPYFLKWGATLRKNWRACSRCSKLRNTTPMDLYKRRIRNAVKKASIAPLFHSPRRSLAASEFGMDDLSEHEHLDAYSVHSIELV